MGALEHQIGQEDSDGRVQDHGEHVPTALVLRIWVRAHDVNRHECVEDVEK